jgi:hypothetical protein
MDRFARLEIREMFMIFDFQIYSVLFAMEES